MNEMGTISTRDSKNRDSPLVFRTTFRWRFPRFHPSPCPTSLHKGAKTASGQPPAGDDYVFQLAGHTEQAGVGDTSPGLPDTAALTQLYNNFLEVVSRITENGSAVSFRPNDDQVINIAFYPKRALYNTTESIVREHFHDIQNCGIGTIILVWHPAFNEGLLRAIFKMAAIHNLKVAIEILEYPERTIEGIRSNIKYFVDLFGKDPDSTLSYFRVLSKQKDLPIFYIRRAYQIADADWMRLLSRNGILTIRGTAYDAIVLAHIGTKEHKSVVRRGGFDGFYTYLPSNGANYASTWKNWSQLKKFGDTYHLMFVPTIGPGYYDRKKYSRSATQNHGINNIKRYRSNGQYYDVAWRTALKNNAQIITINSYNNWVDGTQIEAAIPVFGFRDYLPGPPEKYLDLTQSWVEEYVKYKLNSMARKTDATLGCYDFINNTIC